MKADAVAWLVIGVWVILFVGEPDLLDVIIEVLRRP